MSVHVPTQPVSRSSSSQVGTARSWNQRYSPSSRRRRTWPSMVRRLLAATAQRSDRAATSSGWNAGSSVRRVPRAGSRPVYSAQRALVSRTRPAASVRQAMSGIASARSRYPRSSRSGGSRTSTPGSAVLAGEGESGTAPRCGLSPVCRTWRCRFWLLEQEGRYGRWRGRRNRPCNDVTSPDWRIQRPRLYSVPETIDIVVAEGTSYACRACRSPCTPPGRDRSALRDARPDGLRVRRDPSLGFGGDTRSSSGARGRTGASSSKAS